MKMKEKRRTGHRTIDRVREWYRIRGGKRIELATEEAGNKKGRLRVLLPSEVLRIVERRPQRFHRQS
ncbi:hypothetical protein WK78_05520 [Burkholderia cepacia]|nr:hypothetical protein WK78_05520 [Burkholderia cepacia]